MERYNILKCIQLENKIKKIIYLFIFCEKCEIEKLSASQQKKKKTKYLLIKTMYNILA